MLPARALVALLLFPACAPTTIGGDDSGADAAADSGGADDPTADEVAQAADDDRVRALTDLPEGDVPCDEPFLVRIDWTVDGDTFYATREDDGTDVKVRIIGVDTPEVEHDTPAECYGDEAWAFARAQLEGNLAWLTFDAECVDAYDRTLAYVIRGEGEEGFFDRVLARQGYATEMTIEPNDTYADAIRADVRAARDEGLGLWGACNR